MKAIKQEHTYGCGVACVAFILCTNYTLIISSFDNGEYKAEKLGFYCGELTSFLNSMGLKYKWKYVKSRLRKKIYKEGSIVFIKKSRKYPTGHYLTRCNRGWMDSWINHPSVFIKSGFRKRLPGKPAYAILPE